MTATSFKVNAPSTIHQTLDGEVVIINLATGSYYSLRGSGAAMWELLVAGYTPAQIGQALAGRFDAEPSAVSEAASTLSDELLSEGLIVAGDGTPSAPEAGPNGNATEPFAPPSLEKFEDMQDLILLDPVHEVDEAAGWPHVRPDVG